MDVLTFNKIAVKNSKQSNALYLYTNSFGFSLYTNIYVINELSTKRSAAYNNKSKKMRHDMKHDMRIICTHQQIRFINLLRYFIDITIFTVIE